MNKFQSFLQSLVGIKATPSATTGKSGGYLSFSETNQYALKDLSQEVFLKSYSSWVYAAVSKRADEFAGLKLTLNKIVKKGGDTTIEQQTNHPVLELLDKVNPYLSLPDLLKITQIYKDLAGNAYWWLIRSGNTITEIWPYLRPDRMSVIPSAENFVGGYNYLTPSTGDIERFAAEDIIHFKYPNPLDPYTGASPLEACYLAFNTYQKSSEYNNRFFRNNARADFILNVETPLGETERKQIMAQWESRHKGEGHEHRMAILSGGKGNLLNTGMSARDMEFIEQMKFTRDEILAIFKVPKALLDPQELNYASAKVAKEVFLNEVIVPLMKDFVSSLNEFLLPNYNDDSLFFDFENPGEENPETKYDRYKTLAQVGAIAPNEIRENEGLPPFEGGNNIYMPMNQVPVGGEVDQNQSKMFVGKIDKVKIPKKYNMLIKSKSESADTRERVVEAIKKDIMEKKQRILPKEKKVVTEKQKFNDAMWYAKTAKTDEDERKMRKILSGEFNRQYKQVIKSLREKSFEFNFDIEKEKGIFIKLFAPFFKSIVSLYGESAIDLVGGSGFSMSDRAKDWISKNVKNFSGVVNETTKEKIRSALMKAVEEGEGIPEASKRIKTVFTEANTSRAKAIARTEIIHASNYASVEAWKQSDVVRGKEWLTAADERTCPICEALGNKYGGSGWIGLDEKFKNNDEIFENPPEPPAHVNCRCDLIPVLKTKNLIINEMKDQKNDFKKTIQEVKEAGKKELQEIRETKEKLNQIITNDNG